ncbi:MAG: AAA family ATPase [Pseudomonadota bacterium]
MFTAILPGKNKMKSKISLSSFSLKNFKAVQDSKTIKFTPLTAFVGNNGSGKSSRVGCIPCTITSCRQIMQISVYGGQ